VWLIGLLLDVALYGAIVGYDRLTEPPDPPWVVAARARDDSVARGLLPPPRRLTIPEGVDVHVPFGDSMTLTLRRRGDTITVSGPPAYDRFVANTGRALEAGISAVWIAMAVLFLPIPAALTLLTIAWLAARCPWRAADIVTTSSSSDPAA
jgi:hypothetical protein